MVVIDYVGDKQKLSKVILSEVKNLSYSNIQKLLRKKDIKVNLKRVSSDVFVENGDNIQVYATNDMLEVKAQSINVVFEDENIIAVNKPINIEVESDSNKNNLLYCVNSYLSSKNQASARAVHRLDRNTKGLVLFAKNDAAYKELTLAFKEHKLTKIYEAAVVGVLPKEEDTLVAYLKIDKKSALADVQKSPKAGYTKIITKYKVIASSNDRSYVEIELVTGKTHQIRAHFSFIGHPLIGDGKYGNNQVNKKFGEKTQMLIAKKIIFNFDKQSKLYYLNKKKIEISDSLI